MSDPDEGYQPRAGDVIDGKYRVERELGRGGMGVVMAARHVALDELVAIKFLTGELRRHPEAVQRFTAEAWAAAKIKSDHVIRILDVATLPDATPYLVMEFLDGRDLASYLEEGGFDIDLTVALVMEACEALAEAHRAGIVHRDLKPENLFVARLGDGSLRVKVLDFGISKVGARGNLTHTDAVMGSPCYMAPEQLLSAKNVDVRADIWALGVVLYVALAGRLPFGGDTLAQICTAVLHGDLPPMQRADLPAGLEVVVARCLAKEPDERHPNIAALAEALAPFGGERAGRSAAFIRRVTGLDAPIPEPRASAPSRGDVGTDPLAAHAATDLALSTGITAPSRRAGWLFAVIGLVALLGVAAAVSMSGGETSTANGAAANEDVAADPSTDVASRHDDTAEPSSSGAPSSSASASAEASAAPSASIDQVVTRRPPVAAPPPIAPDHRPQPAQPPAPKSDDDGWGEMTKDR